MTGAFYLSVSCTLSLSPSTSATLLFISAHTGLNTFSKICKIVDMHKSGIPPSAPVPALYLVIYLSHYSHVHASDADLFI